MASANNAAAANKGGKKVVRRRKEKKVVENGQVHIRSSFNNTMMICFGLSWPSAVRKSWVSRTARGKSLLFECLILAGYICGIAGKVFTGNVNYVLILYVINLTVVSADFVLLLRNMVQLLIMWFVIMASVRTSDANMIRCAVLTFGINSGAYVAEIVRSGLMIWQRRNGPINWNLSSKIIYITGRW